MTCLAQSRDARPRVLGGVDRFAVSHCREGTEKPVLAFPTRPDGKAWLGAAASAILPERPLILAVRGLNRRSSSMSTNGVLISMLWAMPAQSASRNNWLRK